MKALFFYVLKAVALGLFLAVIILFLASSIRSIDFNHLFNSKTELEAKVTFSNAARLAAPAVVNIYTRSFQKRNLSDSQQPYLSPQGLGSGVIMSAQGYILTNYHVVAKADQIIIALQDGRIFNASLVGGDLLTDLVVLKINAKDLPVIPQSLDIAPEVGDVVLAIGNPFNVGQTITQGIIGATGRIGMSASHRQDFLQTDAAINEGNSGGALVNTRGELVGINTSAFEKQPGQETYGISFAIPYKLALQVMNSLISEGKVTRGYLGLDGVNITPYIAKQWGIKNNSGVIVKGLDPKGPAAKAGMKQHDILVKVGNQNISDVKQAMDIVAETKPGSTLSLLVLRADKYHTLSVIIEEL